MKLQTQAIGIARRRDWLALAGMLLALGCAPAASQHPAGDKPTTQRKAASQTTPANGKPEESTASTTVAADANPPVAVPSDDDLALDPKPAPTTAPATPEAEVEPASDEARYRPIKYSKTEVPNLAKRTAGEDWPIFLGPTRDSKSSEKGILTDWPVEGPRIVWQRSIGTSYGIGCVSRGRYFQLDRHRDHARLTCMHAETGEPIWHWEYPTAYEDYYGYNNGPRCSPVVDDDRVYIFGAEGMLHCLRVTDGQLFWSVDTAKEFGVVQNFFGVGSTPAIEGDLLICMIGGSPASSQDVGPQLDLAEPNGSGIVAFDKYTGEVKYKTANELASYASMQLATINDRRWGFAFCRGGLVGFEPASGKIDFQYPWRAEILESVNASMPVVIGDEVFISETYGPGSSLLKVAPGKSDVVWADGKRRDKAMQTHWNTAVYHEGYLYGSSGRHETNAELRCIEWKTGKVMWSVPDLTRCSLMYVDGHFVCLGEDGILRLLKATPEKYEMVAGVLLVDKSVEPNLLTGRRPQLLVPPCWAAPILSHGLLYVRGDDRVVCLELIPEKE
jgi:outer membrane protein assembly factor BamB